jgi:dihydroorotate dehydrogenase electron transfer subunit
MRSYMGWVREIRQVSGGQAASIACSPSAMPAPGRYLLAAESDSILRTPLFLGEVLADGFLAAPPLPLNWQPGTELRLSGPVGRGFSLPQGVQRLALAAWGDSLARLLPLVELPAARAAAVAVFTDAALPSLPAKVEASPLSALPEALPWADFLAVDISIDSLSELRRSLGLAAGQRLPCAGGALVLSPMPCVGLADCGVCALPARRGFKLLCKDGPVVDLADLLEVLT